MEPGGTGALPASARFLTFDVPVLRGLLACAGRRVLPPTPGNKGPDPARGTPSVAWAQRHDSSTAPHLPPPFDVGALG